MILSSISKLWIVELGLAPLEIQYKALSLFIECVCSAGIHHPIFSV
jgi:hypothetical protein